MRLVVCFISEPSSSRHILTQDDGTSNSSLNGLPSDSKRMGEAKTSRLARFVEGGRNNQESRRPLREVVGDFMECTETVKIFSAETTEYKILRDELDTIFKELHGHCTQTTPLNMTMVVVGLCILIRRELTYMREMQEHQNVEVRNDTNQTLECYRRIQDHFQRVVLNMNIPLWRIEYERAMNNIMNRLAPSRSVFFNSAEADVLQRQACLPGTRTSVLEQIFDWLDNSRLGSVFWINGMAGTGKTTIAYSLCQELDRDCGLAASFFCSRLREDSRSTNLIIPTIAYQLARTSRPFLVILSEIMERDPDVHMRRPGIQFEALISQPLLRVKDTLPNNLVVVIDALDECENKEGTREILDAILTKSASLPARFVISSRPEPKIRDLMTKHGNQAESRVVLHELDVESVRADIETYIRKELAPMEPTEDEIVALTQQAGLWFLYAAVAVRYIGFDNFQRNPQRRLLVVLDPLGAEKPWERGIDSLYESILRTAVNEEVLDGVELQDMRQVLHTVVCAKEPLTINVLSGLLNINDIDRVRAALRPLWSILHVSAPGELVTMLHPSIPDYLFNSSRSGPYHCDARAHNRVLTLRCFNCLKSEHLSFNICGLEPSFIHEDEAERVEERVQTSLSPQMSYAARYWAVHLYSAIGSPELVHELEAFISVRLLLWMEAMNSMKCPGGMPEAFRLVENWEWTKGLSTELMALINDAQRFIVFALDAAPRSTPHIYPSKLLFMLLFWPEFSPISRLYTRRIRKFRAKGTAINQQKFALLATLHFDKTTMSPTYSPDGTQIAVGVGSNILLLDASTGQRLLPPLNGHHDTVLSVRFSPDGTRMVSGSLDNAIIVWSTSDGNRLVGPVRHTALAGSVAFSPDGAHIVSGSVDGTIGIWDANSGKILLGPLSGCSNGTTFITHSPNKKSITFGHCSETIVAPKINDGYLIKMVSSGINSPASTSTYAWSSGRKNGIGCLSCRGNVWNIKAGQNFLRQIEDIEPNCNDFHRVTAVSFSPDGSHLASGSMDRNIRLWDTRTSSLVLGPLVGHTDSITSIDFSPNDGSMVSGSYDRTLRLWSTRIIHTSSDMLEGHNGSVTSVGFSPDGTRIVTGSADRAICVWEAEGGKLALGPIEKGQSDRVVIKYSPDSTLILADSPDGVVLLDAQTGEVSHRLTKLNQSIQLATFSSLTDGTRVIVGSTQNSVQVFRADTGENLIEISPPITGLSDWVTSLACSHDGTRIAVGWVRSRLNVYDISSGKVLFGPVNNCNNGSRSLCFSPDSSRIVLGLFSAVIVRDAQTGEIVLGPLKGQIGWVDSVEYSPNGAYIVSGARDHSICLWDATTGVPMLGPVKWHTGPVRSVSFSPDGTRIVSGSDDKTIRVTNIRTDFQFVSDSSMPTGSEWELKQDGWVVDKEGRLLVWVPHELHPALMWPRTELLISARGWLRINFRDAPLGESSAESYVLPSSE